MQVLWANTVERLTVNDLIDILIVTFMIYNLLLLTRETKANQVIKGVGILFLAYWISDLLELQAFNWIMKYIMDAGAVVLVVLFQPELRRALEKIGRKTGLIDKTHQADPDEVERMVGEIIRGTRIVAAGCFLPLTEENSISKQLGTRHRAGIGVTENTDATTLIVSEETGTMSMARGGKLTRHLDADAIRTVLHGIYDPDKAPVTGVISPMLNKWRSRK